MKVNLLPYVAVAVAHNSRAMQRLEKLCAPHRSEIVALGEKHECARHRLLMMGRAEHTLSARLFLGFWDFIGDSDDAYQKVTQIIRSGWSFVMLEVQKEAPSIEAVARHSAAFHTDDLSVMLDLVVYVFICITLETPVVSSEGDEKVYSRLSGWIDAVEQERDNGAKFLLDGQRFPEKRRQFFSSGVIWNLSSLYLPDPASHAVSVAQTISGIDLEFYTSGLKLSSEELDAIAFSCQTADEAALCAYWTLTLKSINADKRFALSQSNELPAARYQASEQRLRELSVRYDVLKNQLDLLTEELKQERQRSARREESFSAQSADLAELSALRDALYQLDLSVGGEDDPLPLPKTREVPPRIVSLGGLPGWRAEMGKRFPSAKFIPADVTFSDDVIRAADELWIEPSFLGHSAYYHAVSVAKAASVPVKYFPGRNVDLCVQALQSVQ